MSFASDASPIFGAPLALTHAHSANTPGSTPRAPGIITNGSNKNPIQQAADDQPLQGVVRELAAALDPLADQADMIDNAEYPVQEPHPVARRILGLARANHGVAKAVVQPGQDAVRERALDIAEQDHPRHIGLVLGGVDEGLVEHHGLAVAPVIRLAVDKNATCVGIRGDEPQMVTERTREWVAMRTELSAGRQYREQCPGAAA